MLSTSIRLEVVSAAFPRQSCLCADKAGLCAAASCYNRNYSAIDVIRRYARGLLVRFAGEHRLGHGQSNPLCSSAKRFRAIAANYRCPILSDKSTRDTGCFLSGSFWSQPFFPGQPHTRKINSAMRKLHFASAAACRDADVPLTCHLGQGSLLNSEHLPHFLEGSESVTNVVVKIVCHIRLLSVRVGVPAPGLCFIFHDEFFAS